MYGKEINDRINELNLSQQEVAKYVGVSNTEIKCIRNDERRTIKKDTFLKLMQCLDLDQYDFGGFAKLDFTSDQDFILELDFLKYFKDRIKRDPLLTARRASELSVMSEVQMSRILSHKKTEISIDCFAHICKYIGVNYQDFLVDKNIIPSFCCKEEINLTKMKILKDYISKLTLTDKDCLIQYADFLLNASDDEKKYLVKF